VLCTYIECESRGSEELDNAKTWCVKSQGLRGKYVLLTCCLLTGI
jgi:hypothetical protein